MTRKQRKEIFLDKKIFWLNIANIVSDMIVAILSIASFASVAYYFDKWWVCLFGLLPTFLFYNRGLLLGTAARPEEEKDD